MKRIPKCLLLGAIFFGSYVLWDQYPYRGGTKRCEYLFGINFPDSIEIITLTLEGGSFWDDPRFRFRLHGGQFEQLTEILRKADYSEWKEAGGSYGSFNEESRTDDPLLMSYKYSERWKLMFFYRPSTGNLDAVTFFN
jgi:hypothetical protein